MKLSQGRRLSNTARLGRSYLTTSISSSKMICRCGMLVFTKDLVLTFQGPEVLFDIDKADLKPRFKQILQDFFPRYVKIITSPKYKNSIQEIRIEGHTSSDWNGATGTEEAYFQNMELSQGRTRSTLRFLLKLPDVQKDIDWLRS